MVPAKAARKTTHTRAQIPVTRQSLPGLMEVRLRVVIGTLATRVRRTTRRGITRRCGGPSDYRSDVPDAPAGLCRGISALKSPRLIHFSRRSRSTSATATEPQFLAWAITSPEWSGSETGGRRYSPFVVNVERKKPWHTLTGRMQFFLDHDWIHELGEALPGYRPPLDYARHYGEQGLAEDGRPEVTVRYLTPHSKWSIHSEYADNLHMLRLFRGGPVIWM